MIHVYKVTGPGGKVYIGITKHSLAIRRLQHLSSARRGSRFQLHRALRAHPACAFSWEVVAVTTIRAEAKAIEVALIASHNSLRQGYNCTAGGDGCSKEWTEEQRKRMSESQRRRLANPEARARQSAALKKAYETSAARERRAEIQRKLWQDPAYRSKMSATHRARLASPEGRGEMRRRGSIGLKAIRARVAAKEAS